MGVTGVSVPFDLEMLKVFTRFIFLFLSYYLKICCRCVYIYERSYIFTTSEGGFYL